MDRFGCTAHLSFLKTKGRMSNLDKQCPRELREWKLPPLYTGSFAIEIQNSFGFVGNSGESRSPIAWKELFRRSTKIPPNFVRFGASLYVFVRNIASLRRSM
jgi:hypothetical protein